MMDRLIVVGVGGFGREVAWLVNDINRHSRRWEFQGFIDLCYNGNSTTVEGYPILGDFNWLKRQSRDVDVICALGDSQKRFDVSNELASLGFKFATLISPTVQRSEYVTVGDGSIICAGCILTTNISVGRHVIINPGCTIGHDSTLGDYVSVMPGVRIAGDVNVKTGTYIGIGSNVINKINLGEWSIIGGGATVTQNVPDNVLAVGVPARVIKTIR